jgi:hypothetical protein
MCFRGKAKSPSRNTVTPCAKKINDYRKMPSPVCSLCREQIFSDPYGPYVEAALAYFVSFRPLPEDGLCTLCDRPETNDYRGTAAYWFPKLTYAQVERAVHYLADPVNGRIPHDAFQTLARVIVLKRRTVRK